MIYCDIGFLLLRLSLVFGLVFAKRGCLLQQPEATHALSYLHVLGSLLSSLSLSQWDAPSRMNAAMEEEDEGKGGGGGGNICNSSSSVCVRTSGCCNCFILRGRRATCLFVCLLCRSVFSPPPPASGGHSCAGGTREPRISKRVRTRERERGNYPNELHHSDGFWKRRLRS